MSLAFVLPQVAQINTRPNTVNTQAAKLIQQVLTDPKPIEFPAPTEQQIEQSVAKVEAERAAEAAALEAQRQADCKATRGVYNAGACTYPPPQITTSEGILIGSYGWSTPWGNCVNEPGVNNPGWGNPINWPALYFTPHIGSTVLFTWNHTAVVVGIWSNGDVEVAQQNAPGAPHRIPPSEIRGYR